MRQEVAERIDVSRPCSLSRMDFTNKKHVLVAVTKIVCSYGRLSEETEVTEFCPKR